MPKATSQAATSIGRADRPVSRRTNKRAEIIRQAANLMDDRGYTATSMEDIAEAVGISKPTLYHYFKSKDEILLLIYEETIGLLLSRQDRRAAVPMSPEQQLLEIMSDVLEVIETHPGHVRVFFEHHRELPLEHHAQIMAKRERYHQHAVSVIQRAIDEGVLRADLDPQLAALAMFGACNWAYQWYQPRGEMRSREVAYAFWDMLLHGFAVGR